METSKKQDAQDEPQAEQEQPQSEFCTCNALPLPHVHNEQGIHYPKK